MRLSKCHLLGKSMLLFVVFNSSVVFKILVVWGARI